MLLHSYVSSCQVPFTKSLKVAEERFNLPFMGLTSSSPSDFGQKFWHAPPFVKLPHSPLTKNKTMGDDETRNSRMYASNVMKITVSIGSVDDEFISLTAG
jgi:hypothetical protein